MGQLSTGPTPVNTQPKMLYLLPLLFSVALSAPDHPHHAGWAQNQQQDVVQNVQYGPWVPQHQDPQWDQHRDSKGIVGTITSMIPNTDTLRNFGDWWTWDRQAVFNGIFQNDNIMIHVGQNFFNFIFTTLAWFTISQIYSSGLAGPPTPRSAKSISLTEAADEVLSAIKSFEKKHY